MKTLKLLGAALAVVTMTFTAEAAKTAKAVVADSGATLKFVYDETNYGTKDTDWFAVAEAEAIDPQSGMMPWWDLRSSVSKVVFDGSFAAYRPRHCGAWFNNFQQLATVEGLKNLDVSEATSLTMMFSQCELLTSLDLSGFDTSKVTDMSYMFYGCKKLEQILVSDAFTTDAVTASSYMFYNCMALKGGAGTAYDSTKIAATYARIDGGPSAPGYFTRGRFAKVVVEDGGATLRFVYDGANYGAKNTDWFSVAEAEAIGPYSEDVPWHGYGKVTKVVFDPSFTDYRPTQCLGWFSYFKDLETIENIRNLDTSAATSFSRMFSDCSSLTSLDVTGFDTSKVTDMSVMFLRCRALTSLDVGGFDTANVTNMGYMFDSCSKLTSLNVTGFNTSKVTDMTSMFASCSSLETLDITDFDTSKVTSTHGMFVNDSSLKTIFVSDKFVTTAVTVSQFMFGACTSLVGGAGTAYDASKTADATFARIDGGAASPGYFTPPPSVAKVVVEDGGATLRFVYDNKDYGTKGTHWFSVADALDPYDNPPWYGKRGTVTKVVFDASFKDYQPAQCGHWFYEFENLVTIEDIGNLDTSAATSFAFMFSGCTSLTSLDLSGFDTSKVTDMNSMFDICSSLATLDVSGFDTANVTDMYSMFCGCSSLTTMDVSGFDTANVTDMSVMFYGCSSLTVLDVSGFDTANVTDMSYMFEDCSSLEAICASDRFVTDQVSDSSSMFKYCSKLIGGAGTAYDSTKTDKTYARIDGKDGLPGYFTRGQMTIATGAYASLDLVKDLDIKIPEDVDYAKGDKVTVKVEGLAKGLKLVQDKTSKAWTLSGVPTEEIDFARNPMYARVTVTYKDKTKGDKGKVESLQPIVLSIAAPAPTGLTAGVLGQEYGLFDVTALWSAVGTSKEWSFKGWPAGLKYKDGKLSGKPTKAGVYPITATWKHKINGKSVSETFSAVLTVWGSEGEKGFRHTSQQYGAAVNETIADAKSVSGLPTGLKFKDGKVTGTPTKPGVFAVTVTKTDSTKETFLWKVTPGVNDGILDGIGWEAADSAVTVMQGAIRDWPVTIPEGAKVTASGLPAGLKLAQDKTTKKWTISGTPTKQGNFVVTLKTVRNGVTVTERISIVVEPNEWTGDWHLVQTCNDTDASRLAEVKVSANGTVKLVLTEGVAGKVKKTTVTVKHLDADGTRATVTLPKDKKDPLSKDRTCILGFKAQFLNIDNVTQGCLAEVDESWVNYDVSTVVVEERIGGVPYSYGYVTATFKSGKFTLAGKLWDGTAVKGTCYPLGYDNFFSPVLVTDQQKNSITITLGGVDVVNRAFVRENGTMILGLDVMTASFAAEELKSKKFNQLSGSTRLFISGHDDEGAAVTQLVDIPEKSRAASVSAQGLAKFKVTDEDGWKWVCELLPVRNGDALRFRGIATGTKRGEDVRIAPVWDVQ